MRKKKKKIIKITEKKMKTTLVKLLRQRGCHVQCHEDKFSRYIPDISYAGDGDDGWMELKSVDRFSKLKQTFTVGQRKWLTKRGEAGNHCCHLLARVKDKYYLVHYRQFAYALRSLTAMASHSRKIGDSLRDIFHD